MAVEIVFRVLGLKRNPHHKDKRGPFADIVRLILTDPRFQRLFGVSNGEEGAFLYLLPREMISMDFKSSGQDPDTTTHHDR